MTDTNPIIHCDICGGRYRKYFKKKHYDTQLHKEAENKKLLDIDTEESRQLYDKNKEIEKLKEIIHQQRIMNQILSNK